MSIETEKYQEVIFYERKYRKHIVPRGLYQSSMNIHYIMEGKTSTVQSLANISFRLYLYFTFEYLLFIQSLIIDRGPRECILLKSIITLTLPS